MTTPPRCVFCFKWNNGTPVCSDCRDAVARELVDVGEMFDDLDTTITRTDKMGGVQLGVTVTSKEVPLPFNLRASNARSNLLQVLSEHNLAALARLRGSHATTFVDARVRKICSDNPQRLVEIRAAVDKATARARRAIDRPAQREWIGPCDCSTDLYAAPGETAVECLQCERVHNVDVYRRRLLRAAGNHFEGTATELAAMMSRFGYKVAPGTITQWGVRGKLTASGTRRGKPSYRLDHVIELVRRSGQRDELEPYRALARALS